MSSAMGGSLPKRIGFIGAGLMGSAMIRNLRASGYCVNVATQTQRKAA